eukprot:CAMPEP_0167740606 /NCGR_PEP_ID=MMETSP0110_2-20121227/375_1 /TAXON_ID=629695 /ORGANISM="Gymnochlora sp., Strain CCMP2014" /LENGTH=122 /DNA_ID=CAMNT_0007624527 /DNA_START=114 /DNA_END=482 /DNA_ORIENTATION=-
MGETRDAFQMLLNSNSSTEMNYMERYVRVTMFTLLSYLANPNYYVSKGHGNKEVTLKDLAAYCDYFPKEIRGYYRDNVERILNLNGHSLTLNMQKPYSPEKLAELFRPIALPVLNKDASDSD